MRLLQKIPLTLGTPGFEMAGSALPAKPGKDVDLGEYAGPGTRVERTRDGEFLVSERAGFLAVEAKTSRISIEDKIVSRDGVSVRTTGNLQLTGDYVGGSRSRLVFGADPLALLETYRLPGTPYGVAHDDAAQVLWVTLTGRNEVVGLSTAGERLTEVARFPTVRQPNTVAVDPGSGRVFVASRATGELQLIDP